MVNEKNENKRIYSILVCLFFIILSIVYLFQYNSSFAENSISNSCVGKIIDDIPFVCSGKINTKENSFASIRYTDYAYPYKLYEYALKYDDSMLQYYYPLYGLGGTDILGVGDKYSNELLNLVQVNLSNSNGELVKSYYIPAKGINIARNRYNYIKNMFNYPGQVSNTEDDETSYFCKNLNDSNQYVVTNTIESCDPLSIYDLKKSVDAKDLVVSTQDVYSELAKGYENIGLLFWGYPGMEPYNYKTIVTKEQVEIDGKIYKFDLEYEGAYQLGYILNTYWDYISAPGYGNNAQMWETYIGN